MKMTKGLLMTALITGTLMSSAAAFAEELQEYTLDQMVVTATRYEKRDVEVAASTEVFDAKKLQETGATNLYDALKFGAGLDVQQYGTGGASMGNMTSKIMMRGNGNGTLVLVNGVPINIRGTYDLNDFPVENIERVEIVRGGGAVMYGSDATGGVINIITKKERANYIKAGLGNYGQQEYAASVQAGNLGFGYKYSKWGKVTDVSIEKSNTASTKDWRGPENNNFDLSYKFNDRLSLQASHNESAYHYISTLGKTAMKKYTPANDTKQDIKRNNIQLTYDDKSFKATAYYIDRQREKDAAVLDGRFYSWEDEKTYNYGLDMQKAWNINEDTLLVGATYQSENFSLDSKNQAYKEGNILDKGVVADSSGDQSRNNFSVYAQFDKKLSEQNSFVLAARETWTTGSPNGANFSNFSGQAQFIHSLNDNESIYASVGQSFKMPALYQIYKTDKNGDGADTLKPQKGTHYELGWKKDIDTSRNLRVALFNYKVNDNISASIDSTTNEFTYSNENLRNTGIEASYAMVADKGFGYNLSATYSNPQTQNIDKNGHNFGWQDDYSKFELKAGLTYHMDKWKAALNASFLDGRNTYKTTSKSKKVTVPYVTKTSAKPYLLTNLNVEYKAQDDLSFFATFNNIFDRQDVVYYSTSAEYYATPFNFMLGATYTF